jgi:hypothetical protein
VNFALFSRHATGVRLDFFDRAEDAAPSRTVSEGLACAIGRRWFRRS